MSYLFIEYPKCSTCKKAKKFLDDNGIQYTDRHIVEDNPTAEELCQWHQRSGLPVKRFVNTSGQLYRAQNLKDVLPQLDDQGVYDLLSTNGMLVKRPILVGESFVLTGFKEQEWRAALHL